MTTNVDWTTDYYAQSSRKLIVGAAGNNTNPGLCLNNNNIWSPSKAWNVLTVGASGHNNDANWSNDYLAPLSDWLNPASGNNDHEKPEVVAPGVSLQLVGPQGTLATVSGTSFAAPQVAGEAALLIDRNAQLRYASPALRAIIMSTATNNIDDTYTGIPGGQDHKDGAGGINADLADMTAISHVSQAATCSIPCWWQEDIMSSMFPNGQRYYQFQGQAGDRVRVAISWFANGQCGEGGCTSYLGTDLNLAIYAPDNSLVTGGYSASWDNNYELVPTTGYLTLPQTGTYKIRVSLQRIDDVFNTIGVAWTKLPVTNGFYEDTLSSITHYGAWTYATGMTNATAGTLSWTNVLGNKARFSFTGNRITYIYSMEPNRGSTKITVDGVDYILNSTTPEIRRQVARTWDVPYGDHTIDVAPNGGGFTDLDAFAVDIVTVGTGTYDDYNAQVKYIGTWSPQPSVPDAFDNTLHWSNTNGSVVRFTFTGNQVTYVYSKAANRGYAAVTIDGVNKPYIDQWAASTIRKQSTIYSGLGPGTHTIHITVSGQKNVNATDDFVDVDRFTVP